MVESNRTTTEGTVTYRTAQHIKPLFPPLSVLKKEDLEEAFLKEDPVMPCSNPDLCHLNVNSFLFHKNGPFKHEYTCINTNIPRVLSITHEEGVKIKEYGPSELQELITIPKIIEGQKDDKKCQNIFADIDRQRANRKYILDKGLLRKKDKKGNALVMVPQLLIPIILSLFHFKTHSGYEKLSLLIKTQYTWKGCLLCNMYKAYQVPKNKVGFARPIFNPLNCVQIDIVSGLVSVKGYDRILTCIDMFFGIRSSDTVEKRHESKNS